MPKMLLRPLFFIFWFTDFFAEKLDQRRGENLVYQLFLLIPNQEIGSVREESCLYFIVVDYSIFLYNIYFFITFVDFYSRQEKYFSNLEVSFFQFSKHSLWRIHKPTNVKENGPLCCDGSHIV